jgi:hypothetical protein
MKAMLNFVGMTIGGWIGWELGGMVSVFTAYMVSAVGTGIGLYVAQRVMKQLMP